MIVTGPIMISSVNRIVLNQPLQQCLDQINVIADAERREIIVIAERFDVGHNVMALQFAFLPARVKTLLQPAY